jgi:hypothetical protein
MFGSIYASDYGQISYLAERATPGVASGRLPDVIPTPPGDLATVTPIERRPGRAYTSPIREPAPMERSSMTHHRLSREPVAFALLAGAAG